MILDCPPNMTLLSENIIIVADMVVTPIIPTILSILSLAQLVKLADKLGVNLKKLVAFFSMVDRRKNMHSDTIAKFGKRKMFLASEISSLADVEKMGLHLMYKERALSGKQTGPSSRMVNPSSLLQEFPQSLQTPTTNSPSPSTTPPPRRQITFFLLFSWSVLHRSIK